MGERTSLQDFGHKKFIDKMLFPTDVTETAVNAKVMLADVAGQLGIEADAAEEAEILSGEGNVRMKMIEILEKYVFPYHAENTGIGTLIGNFVL